MTAIVGKFMVAKLGGAGLSQSVARGVVNTAAITTAGVFGYRAIHATHHVDVRNNLAITADAPLHNVGVVTGAGVAAVMGAAVRMSGRSTVFSRGLGYGGLGAAWGAAVALGVVKNPASATFSFVDHHTPLPVKWVLGVPQFKALTFAGRKVGDAAHAVREVTILRKNEHYEREMTRDEFEKAVRDGGLSFTGVSGAQVRSNDAPAVPPAALPTH